MVIMLYNLLVWYALSATAYSSMVFIQWRMLMESQISFLDEDCSVKKSQIKHPLQCLVWSSRESKITKVYWSPVFDGNNCFSCKGENSNRTSFNDLEGFVAVNNSRVSNAPTTRNREVKKTSKDDSGRLYKLIYFVTQSGVEQNKPCSRSIKGNNSSDNSDWKGCQCFLPSAVHDGRFGLEYLIAKGYSEDKVLIYNYKDRKFIPAGFKWIPLPEVLNSELDSARCTLYWLDGSDKKNYYIKSMCMKGESTQIIKRGAIEHFFLDRKLNVIIFAKHTTRGKLLIKKMLPNGTREEPLVTLKDKNRYGKCLCGDSQFGVLYWCQYSDEFTHTDVYYRKYESDAPPKRLTSMTRSHFLIAAPLLRMILWQDDRVVISCDLKNGTTKELARCTKRGEKGIETSIWHEAFYVVCRSRHRDTIYLYDKDGNRIHTIRAPYRGQIYYAAG